MLKCIDGSILSYHRITNKYLRTYVPVRGIGMVVVLHTFVNLDLTCVKRYGYGRNYY